MSVRKSYEDRVDPSRLLDVKERLRRMEALRKADVARGHLKGFELINRPLGYGIKVPKHPQCQAFIRPHGGVAYQCSLYGKQLINGCWFCNRHAAKVQR